MISYVHYFSDSELERLHNLDNLIPEVTNVVIEGPFVEERHPICKPNAAIFTGELADIELLFESINYSMIERWVLVNN